LRRLRRNRLISTRVQYSPRVLISIFAPEGEILRGRAENAGVISGTKTNMPHGPLHGTDFDAPLEDSMPGIMRD